MTASTMSCSQLEVQSWTTSEKQGHPCSAQPIAFSTPDGIPRSCGPRGALSPASRALIYLDWFNRDLEKCLIRMRIRLRFNVSPYGLKHVPGSILFNGRLKASYPKVITSNNGAQVHRTRALVSNT